MKGLTGHSRAVHALLAAARGEPVPAETLLRAMYPEKMASYGKAILSHTVRRLRTRGYNVIAVQNVGYLLADRGARPITAPHVRRFVAALRSGRGETVPYAEIFAEVWGDEPPSRAMGGVRMMAKEARTRGVMIVADPGRGYRLVDGGAA